MNSIREVYTCRLTTLTPVHVGSGDVLRKNIDFIADRYAGKIIGLNMGRLFQAVEEMGYEGVASFTEACDKGDLRGWFKSIKLRPDRFATFQSSLSGNDVSRDIRQQQRNAFGVPYLPGSSIKGALRTAVIVQLASEDPRLVQNTINGLKRGRANTRSADRGVTEKLLGTDPKKNLMRCLTVGDAVFSDNRPVVGVARIASMRRPKGYGYKKFLIVVECMKRNTVGGFQLSLDTWLTGENATSLDFRIGLSFDWIRKAVLDLSKKLADSEAQFCSDELKHPELAAFYRNELLPAIQSVQQNEIIMNMGWGIGWEGTTGGLLSKDMLSDDLRKTLRLAADRLDFPFPKSRKIADVDSRITPWGWVKIAFLKHDRNDGIPAVEQTAQVQSVLSAVEQSARETAPPDPILLLKEQIDALAPDKIAGTAGNIVSKIEALESVEAKTEAARHFLTKISRKQRKNFKSKKWFETLYILSGEES